MSDSNLKTAGRGFLFITGAKVYFLFTSTIVLLTLPRLFGSPALYGLYRVVNGVLNVLTMVFVTATIQVASRFASSMDSPGPVLKAGFKAAALVGIPVALLLVALSGWLSTDLLHDEQARMPLVVASGVVLCYAFYAVVIGVFNGIKRFGVQASFDVGFATLKTMLIIGLVAVGAGVTGAFAGFSIAAFLILIIALFMAGRLPKSQASTGLSLREYLVFGAPLVAYFFVLNMFLQGDVIALKSLGFAPIHASFLHAGRSMDEFFAGFGLAANKAALRGLSAATASSVAGIFGAAKNVAMIPYQAVISITFVAFPFISRASALGDKSMAGKQATAALRAALLLSGLSVAMLGAAPTYLLRLLFGHAYANAGPFLTPTLVSVLLFAFMFVSNSLLVGTGRPGQALWAGAAALVVQMGVLQVLRYFFDVSMLMAYAALADIAGAATGGVLAWIFLKRALGEVKIIKTLVVSMLAGFLVAEGLARMGLTGLSGMALAWTIAFLAYMGIVIALGIVTRDDLSRVKGMLKRGNAKNS